MFNLSSEKFIINSLLDVDFYKFTMGQLAFHKHRNVNVRYELIVRNKDINIADEIDIRQLRKELNHVRTLRFNTSEIAYLRGIDEYGDRMFKEDYLKFLSLLKLPKFYLKLRKGKLVLGVKGKWPKAIFWETIMLCIITELRSRKFLADKTEYELQLIKAEAMLKFDAKLNKLNNAWDSGLRFSVSDFSTRRRAFHDTQDYIVRAMAERLPKEMYRGTSNVYFAYKYGQLPMGTIAHEASMAYSAFYRDMDVNDLVYSQRQLLYDWDEEYPGGGLTVALPDTYGSPFFLNKVFTPEQAKAWKGLRQDSGDPFLVGQSYIDFYHKLGINPKEKQVIFSDGLNVDTIIELATRFMHQLKIVATGPGSNFSNDFGFPSISIVVKLVEVNGLDVAKLSDNLGKGTGSEEEVQRVTELTGYDNHFTEKPTY